MEIRERTRFKTSIGSRASNVSGRRNRKEGEILATLLNQGKRIEIQNERHLLQTRTHIWAGEQVDPDGLASSDSGSGHPCPAQLGASHFLRLMVGKFAPHEQSHSHDPRAACMCKFHGRSQCYEISKTSQQGRLQMYVFVERLYTLLS